MEIPLINTYLKIEISRKPKVEKLKKELSDFFNKNEILGIKIEDFGLTPQNRTIEIYPNLKGRKFFGVGQDYHKEIERIGKKYNISQLRFALSCYGK